MKNVVHLLLVGLVLCAGFAFADTIVNTQTGETYHGYLTGSENAGLSDANTTEKGLIKIKDAQ